MGTLLTKPHIRMFDGYWRVSAVPTRWNRLSAEQRNLWRRAHDVIAVENNRRKAAGLVPKKGSNHGQS